MDYRYEGGTSFGMWLLYLVVVGFLPVLHVANFRQSR